jgi:hypothetical protein
MMAPNFDDSGKVDWAMPAQGLPNYKVAFTSVSGCRLLCTGHVMAAFRSFLSLLFGGRHLNSEFDRQFGYVSRRLRTHFLDDMHSCAVQI